MSSSPNTLLSGPLALCRGDAGARNLEQGIRRVSFLRLCWGKPQEKQPWGYSGLCTTHSLRKNNMRARVRISCCSFLFVFTRAKNIDIGFNLTGLLCISVRFAARLYTFDLRHLDMRCLGCSEEYTPVSPLGQANFFDLAIKVYPDGALTPRLLQILRQKTAHAGFWGEVVRPLLGSLVLRCLRNPRHPFLLWFQRLKLCASWIACQFAIALLFRNLGHHYRLLWH